MSALIDCAAPTGPAPRTAGHSAAGSLPARATEAGLGVRAAASWPETATDTLPPLAGFVVSTFNPLVAEVARRVLSRCSERVAGVPTNTAVILVSALGDVTSAAHVAAAVDAGDRVKPLMFFQSVPNAVAGFVAARWQLTGPVVCVAAVRDALSIADLLICDGDADDALVVLVQQAYADGDDDRAEAVLVGAAAQDRSQGGQP